MEGLAGAAGAAGARLGGSQLPGARAQRSRLSLVAEALPSSGFSSCLLTKADFSLGNRDVLEGKFRFLAL